MNTNHGDLVAGAAAEGYGILVGWTGAGDMPRARLVEIASAVPGVDQAWLPRAKDPGVQLTRAVHAAQSGMYSAERVEKSTWDRHAEPREWSSRWLLVSRAGSSASDVGAAYGAIALRATLYLTTTEPGYELVIESSDDGLAIAVRSGFDARIAAETYQAADVTAWLSTTLRDKLHAVRYGGNWYVPRATRAIAEGLCAAFAAAGWGRAWMTPALPIATSAQLALGLAYGLSDEAGEIAGLVRTERAAAALRGAENLGERRAQTLLARLRDVGARMARYAETLGPALASCHVAFCDAMIELSTVIPTVDPEREWSRAVGGDELEMAVAA